MITVSVSRESAKKGGDWRLAGVMISLAMGALCILGGYAVGFSAGQPYQWYEVVPGVISMIVGVVCILIGTSASATATREHVELEERVEQLAKEREPSAYCAKCGEQLARPGGVCQACASQATVGKGIEDTCCRKCGRELMGVGGPCQRCDDYETRLCPRCSRYTPKDRANCIWCEANADQGPAR